jgi:hypothetical protein
MQNRLLICLLALLTLICASSCTKLPEPAAMKAGDLPRVAIPDRDAIPLEWGEIIAITSEPASPTWVQIWLRDMEGTIRMVGYNLHDNALGDDAVVIHRR